MDTAILGMTVAQAARALGVPRGRIDWLIRSGRMDCTRFGPLRIVRSLEIRPPKRGVGRPRKA